MKRKPKHDGTHLILNERKVIQASRDFSLILFQK